MLATLDGFRAEYSIRLAGRQVRLIRAGWSADSVDQSWLVGKIRPMGRLVGRFG